MNALSLTTLKLCWSKTPAQRAHCKSSLLPWRVVKVGRFSSPCSVPPGQAAGLGSALAARLGGMVTSLLTAGHPSGEPRLVLWLQVSSQTLSRLFRFTPTFWSPVLGPWGVDQAHTTYSSHWAGDIVQGHTEMWFHIGTLRLEQAKNPSSLDWASRSDLWIHLVPPATVSLSKKVCFVSQTRNWSGIKFVERLWDCFKKHQVCWLSVEFSQSSIPSVCATQWDCPTPCQALPGMAQVKPSRQGSAGRESHQPPYPQCTSQIGTVQLSLSAGHTPPSLSTESGQRQDFSKVFEPRCSAEVMLEAHRHSVVPLNLSSHRPQSLPKFKGKENSAAYRPKTKNTMVKMKWLTAFLQNA